MYFSDNNDQQIYLLFYFKKYLAQIYAITFKNE